MLRYDCPVQAPARYLKIGLEVGVIEIKINKPIFVIVAAANYGPAHFLHAN